MNPKKISIAIKRNTAILLFFALSKCFAQVGNVNYSSWNGTFVVGYVDNGAFLNFTGPNISYNRSKDSKFALGLFPSLRFKTDKGPTKNSFITPNLGAGLTYTYQSWSFQIPLYYNPKTLTKNGQWKMGFGIGVTL
jgi:hypothetical protein